MKYLLNFNLTNPFLTWGSTISSVEGHAFSTSAFSSPKILNCMTLKLVQEFFGGGAYYYDF